LQIELAEEKSQSLHSLKSPQWAEQNFKKEKNCYFEWYNKTCVCRGRPEIGPKHLSNLSLNPARPEKPGPT